MNKQETTEHALVMLWKIASHTVGGCVAIMKTINDLMDDDDYDRELLISAHELAFSECQRMQIKDSQMAWAGEL